MRLKSEPKANDDEEPLPPPPSTIIPRSKPLGSNELAAAFGVAPKETERKQSNGELVHQKSQAIQPKPAKVNFANAVPSTSTFKAESDQRDQITPTEQVTI